MLPIALVGGAVFHEWMGYLTFLSPYLIFLMLFITYCKLKPRDFRPGRFECVMLGVQTLLSAMIYFAMVWWNPTVAQGAFICVFVPTATAAPVITSMLGGSISKVASYSLICNLFVALTGPVVLALIGDKADYTFAQSFSIIISKVAPLLLCPLALALLLRYLWPKAHAVVVRQQQLSFYMWAVALFVIVGSCVSFAIKAWTPAETWTMLALVGGALVACLVQFRIGRRVGEAFGDPVAGGQSLMQKNTVLAVWLALAYMNPVASLGPAAYIAWQNILNSWQLIKNEED